MLPVTDIRFRINLGLQRLGIGGGASELKSATMADKSSRGRKRRGGQQRVYLHGL